MIVVVGSRHDKIALDLVAMWPGAALCAAEDLVQPGWAWRNSQLQPRTWVINGKFVRDDRVSGVFLRRSAVYGEELATIHPADRAFLAAEAHAFLTFVLATTSARVCNPVVDGAFGEEALRPERWMALAPEVGISIHPLRLTSERRRRSRPRPACWAEVVGDKVFGNAPSRMRTGAVYMAAAMRLVWGAFAFDARQRLITITSARRPSKAAALALGRLLGERTKRK